MTNHLLKGFILVILLAFGAAALAQDSYVTQDEVYDIAAKMYCPICENEPLDECYNVTCMQWKSEIRERLADGQTEDDIISYFVTNYGQHVVGIPQDPLLRLISYVPIIAGVIIAAVIGFMTFSRWQQAPAKRSPATASIDNSSDYRSQIERDLG